MISFWQFKSFLDYFDGGEYSDVLLFRCMQNLCPMSTKPAMRVMEQLAFLFLFLFWHWLFVFLK